MSIKKWFEELPKDYLLRGVFITQLGEVRWWATNNQHLLSVYELHGVHNFSCTENMQFVYRHAGITAQEAQQILSNYPHYQGQEY